jgi:hypothetical protein
MVISEIGQKENLQHICNLYYYKKDKNNEWIALIDKLEPVVVYYDVKTIFTSEYLMNDSLFFSVYQAITITSDEKN